MPFKEPFKPKWKSPLGDFTSQVDLGASSLAKPPKSPIPDSNPLRVGLESNPIPKAVSRQEASYYGEALQFAKQSAWVVADVAKDEVQEKVVVATLGRTVATAVGVVAIPFVAADIMESLAPGVKKWLLGGWAGSSGRGIPGVPSEDLLLYGQEDGSVYALEGGYSIYTDSFGSVGFVQTSWPEMVGPVNITDNRRIGLQTSAPGTEVFIFQPKSGSRQAFGDGWGMVPGSSTTKLRKLFGPPDVPVAVPQPDKPSPILSNPRPSEGGIGSHPRPPSPNQNLPSTQALSDLLDSVVDLYSRFGGLLDPSRPSPESSTLPEAITEPYNPTYPKPPRNPVPPFTEADSCDPCAFKIGKKLEEISDKLDEKKEDEEDPDEPTCETYPFVYSYGICDNGEFRIEQKTLLLAEKPSDELRAEFDSVLSRLAEACGKDAVAAIPDWWQVRIGAERKQIVVVYRKEDSRTYHQIALPHPASVTKWTSNLLGDYQKGSFQGILTLKDNSKFIINCISEAESLRMIARAKSLINPEMILSPSPEVVSQRRGAAVANGAMYGRSALYFSTGQKSAKPDWRANFSPS